MVNIGLGNVGAWQHQATTRTNVELLNETIQHSPEGNLTENAQDVKH